MKKRIISMLLVLVMAIATLSACGGSGSSNKTANFEVPEGGYDGSEVTITFYHTMGASLREVLDNYITEFNKLYPNIHIEHEQVGGYDDVKETISTKLTAGEEPNIAYCYPDHVAVYNISKSVVTLDNLIASTEEITRADGTTEILGLTQEQISDFIQGYYDEGKAFGDDLMYTIPLSKSTEVLYYNKTFFDEHNLSVPTTWDEMKELCKTIKEIDPECIPLGYDSEGNWFITMCEQYGSDYTSADDSEHYLFVNDENKAFVKEFRDWFQKGYVTTQTLYGAYTSGLFIAESGQRSYMSIGSSAGATHQRPTQSADGTYPFEVGIASIPQVDADNAKAISQGPSLCIFQKDNSQEIIASWLFVKYLATCVEFQAEFSMVSGYIPVIKSVSENSVYSDFLGKADGYNNIAALAVKVGLEQENSYFVSPAFNGSSTARAQVEALMTKCLSQSATDVDALIKQAFDDAYDECKYYD